MNFNDLGKDEIFLVAVKLEMVDLINLSRVNKKLNSLIVKEDIWMYKLGKDYPHTFRKMDRSGLKNWKEYYIVAYRITKIKTQHLNTQIERTGPINISYGTKWNNPSGLSPIVLAGLKLRTDKNNLEIAYLYPASYYDIFRGIKPKDGENHPNIMMKFSLLKRGGTKIEEVPWDESVLGEELHYRRGNGRVSWYDEFFKYKIEYDGMENVFNIFSVDY